MSNGVTAKPIQVHVDRRGEQVLYCENGVALLDTSDWRIWEAERRRRRYGMQELNVLRLLFERDEEYLACLEKEGADVSLLRKPRPSPPSS